MKKSAPEFMLSYAEQFEFAAYNAEIYPESPPAIDEWDKALQLASASAQLKPQRSEFYGS